MRKHMGLVLKSGAFLLILAFIMLPLTWIFLPKTYFSDEWSNTSTIVNFYRMEKDSIDVLFMGSSHCISAFSPQELYDRYGLRSYNLGTEQQSLLVSYYWLKEALRYQHPKAVVLDTYICFPYLDTPLNTREAAVRYAIDPMRWSPVKIEAIAAICAYDAEQTAISYYYPLNRFHERWTSLDEDDFNFAERLSHGEMKGYALLQGSGENELYQPFEPDPSAAPAEMVPLMQEYLDKIASLCEENDIELILVKTPALASGAARYNCMHAYAGEHGLAYYDFNESGLYRETNYQFSVDNRDRDHPNYLGAEKVSDKMGEILTGERHQIPAVYDEQWEQSRAFYERSVQNAKLCGITEAAAYLQAVDRSACCIFIAAKDDALAFMNDRIAGALQQLGLSADLRGKYGYSYYAVISPEGILEDCAEQQLAASGTFCGGRCTYRISSAGSIVGSGCSILIDDTEYAKMNSGLNIVVYDLVYRKVIDSVCFDTGAPTLDALR